MQKELRLASLSAAQMVIQMALMMEMKWVLQKEMSWEPMMETLTAMNWVYSTDVRTVMLMVMMMEGHLVQTSERNWARLT
eukprot:scaffold9188_cov46-Skeletonema_menzelii.AAC.1